MDHQVEKMKLTRFGFRLNLLGFSSFLSVLGIIASIIGMIGGIVIFWAGSKVYYYIGPGYSQGITLFVIGAIALILMILYIIMWILLKIKTSKQDIHGIEKIGKVYSYVSGSLEIIGAIALIIYSSFALEAVERSAPILIRIIFLHLHLWFSNLFHLCLPENSRNKT